MRKILFLIASVGLLMATFSCKDDDKEPDWRGGTRTIDWAMVNHIYNTVTGEVGISDTHNKLTINFDDGTASLELNYNDGSAKTLLLDDLKATQTQLYFYELTSPSNNNFKGYADFGEGGSMRYCYTTPDGLRIISTMPEIFFNRTWNVITYDDTTEATSMENVMYQFEIAPATQTAIIKVMGIVHAKDVKYFNSITANNVPYTVTPNGFTISGENLKTSAYYRTYVDTTGSVVSQTDKYPFKTFNATVDMAGDHLDANYMIGASATVVASGKTYPDYTSY